MVNQLNVRIVNYRLENMTMTFRKDGPEWFGFVHYLTHGPL
ncbi:hypothetical protein CCUG63697_04681 [Mycobacteroides franklinii]|uniref:Uncharacterized protein n=1 Tax=Mycobacteroides franklinii TaxID=948102 RepID=A0A4R8QX47_9MYCO|nr:hypothetical protein CCUG63697_04681 [Mycobacteroides franklinii]